MRRIFLYVLTIVVQIQVYASIPADISFIVIDLKYNENDGVKVCEIQQGLGCVFEGVEFLEGRKNVLGKIFTDLLEPYSNRNWFIFKGISPEFLHVFINDSKWKYIKKFKDILTDSKIKKYALKNVKDESSISDYHGIIVGHYKLVTPKVLKKINGLIVLNRAFFSSFGEAPFTDKLLMSNLLTTDEKLTEIKPAWNVYDKGYSRELVEQIKNDFSSDIIVIKPRAGLQGRGVIILKKEDLAETLRYIFSDSQQLKKNPDKAYNWWASDKYDNFLIESFIESDPVYASHLSDDVYDGTMRVPAVLTYDKGKIDVHLLYMWWKLPRKSLNEKGTLIEKHKSFSRAPNRYVTVDPQTMEKVREQLTEALPILYKGLLDSP